MLEAALQAVDPRRAVEQYLQRIGQTLTVAGQGYSLAEYRRVFLVGVGKASVAMAQAVAAILGDSLYKGVIITKNLPEEMPSELGRVEVCRGSHPIPTEESLRSTQRVLDLLEEVEPADLVLCVFSGGGSPLLTRPVQGASLKEIQQLTSELLTCGATIQEMNAIRKHLDQVKGGKLLKAVHGARVITLILSDVIGNPLEIVASGPTVPDPSTFADALRVIQKFDLESRVPVSIQSILQKGVDGHLEETLKPGDPVFNRTQTVLVGSNYQAAQAAAAEASAHGLQALLLTTYLRGEARQTGDMLAALARQIEATNQPLARPACIIAGGETTVTLRGNGRGGRNQEVALGAVEGMAGLKNTCLVTLATDGEDGPTDAAGALVSGSTLRRAQGMGLDALDYLRRNDAYHFFEQIGDLLKTGPTGTNVNDLNFIFAL